MGIVSLRKELREVSLPVLMREARHRKIITAGDESNVCGQSTVFCRQRDLVDKPSAAPQDRRKFEAAISQ